MSPFHPRYPDILTNSAHPMVSVHLLFQFRCTILSFLKFSIFMKELSATEFLIDGTQNLIDFTELSNDVASFFYRGFFFLFLSITWSNRCHFHLLICAWQRAQDLANVTSYREWVLLGYLVCPDELLRVTSIDIALVHFLSEFFLVFPHGWQICWDR